MSIENTEECVAKVITVCILQKAYETSSLWSKWILLASLDELLGKPAPLLNETQLYSLLGITLNSNKDNDKSSSKDESLSSNIICSRCKSIIQVSNKDTQCNLPFENSLTNNSLFEQASLASLPISLQSSLNLNVGEIEKVDKIFKKQVNPSNDPVGKGIVNFRAVLLSQNSKTEFEDIKERKLLLTPERKEKCHKLQSISQYSQTIVVSTVDKSVNTDVPYKLRKISDPNIELRYNIKKGAHRRYSILIKNDKIKLFHGRTLIVRDSSMKPAIIPLERLLPDLDIGDLCLDPRVERPKMKDERSSSLEEINGSLMDISSCDDSISNDNVKEEGNESSRSDMLSQIFL